MKDEATSTPEQKAFSEWLFAQPCEFTAGSMTLSHLPYESLPEIAFAGRSNVGKSSLINALTNRKSLARTSQTPGRTQQINFFNLGNYLSLVDLPGYGYAQASKASISRWTALIHQYLKGRSTLKRVYILIDARHGLKALDEEIMEMLDEAAVSYQLVLTKCDKLSKTALNETLESLIPVLKKHPAAHPNILATSAEKKEGITELRIEMSLLSSYKETF